MEYVVVAFRSRAHTVSVSKILRANGISNEIVNTPKEAGVGCGLSLKISPSQLNLTKKVVYSLSLPSFAGFFWVKNVAGGRIVKTI